MHFPSSATPSGAWERGFLRRSGFYGWDDVDELVKIIHWLFCFVDNLLLIFPFISKQFMSKQSSYHTHVPSQWVGPISVKGLPKGNQAANHQHIEQIMMPLATYEIPMWASVRRGARVFSESGGLQLQLLKEGMSRSVAFRCVDAAVAQSCSKAIEQQFDKLAAAVKTVSRFTELQDIHVHQVGNLLFLRLSFITGDASGHNMATLASQHIQTQLLNQFSELSYVSISGNLCTDKKTSAINGILGRGKHIIADCVIPEKWLKRYLHTTAEKMEQLHIQKNLVGSIAAGSLLTANAHFANMLLAFYLACGQDGANVVEGSQGMTHVECRGDRRQDLYFSVSIPNVIVGSIGNGKHLSGIKAVLNRLCPEDLPLSRNAQRLAMIAAACVASGELSLLAAQTNPGELVAAHMRLER